MPVKKSVKPAKKKAVKKTAAAKKPAAPKYEYQRKNGVTRPKPGGTTARIWEMADDLTEKTGKPAERAEVLEKAAKAKLKPHMAASQFFGWQVFNGFSKAKCFVKAKKALTAPKGQKLPKPPKSAKVGKGRIGKAKGNVHKPAGLKAKLPKPPKKVSTPAPAAASEAVAVAPAVEAVPAAS